MKLKKRIKILEAQVSGLKKQVEKDRLILVDQCNPNLSAIICIKNGEFTIEKVTTETKETSELIMKDNK